MLQLNLQVISFYVQFAARRASHFFFLRLLGSVATFFPLISTSNFSLLETRGVALYISSSIPRLLGRTLWLKR